MHKEIINKFYESERSLRAYLKKLTVGSIKRYEKRKESNPGEGSNKKVKNVK